MTEWCKLFTKMQANWSLPLQGCTSRPGTKTNNKILGCPGGLKICYAFPGSLQWNLRMTVWTTLWEWEEERKVSQQEGGGFNHPSRALPPDQAFLRSMWVLGLSACTLHGRQCTLAAYTKMTDSRWKGPAPPPFAPPTPPAPGPDEASTSSHVRTSSNV